MIRDVGGRKPVNENRFPISQPSVWGGGGVKIVATYLPPHCSLYLLLPEMRQMSSLNGKIRPEPEFLIFYKAKESIPPSYSHCLSDNTEPEVSLRWWLNICCVLAGKLVRDTGSHEKKLIVSIISLHYFDILSQTIHTVYLISRRMSSPSPTPRRREGQVVIPMDMCKIPPPPPPPQCYCQTIALILKLGWGGGGG